MKRKIAKAGALVRRVLGVLGVAAAVGLATGCDDGKTVDDDPNEGGGATTVALTLEQQKEMVSIPAMSITGSGSSGVFIAGRTVTLSAYQIARYETTYELWYEVKTWAASHGYTFANPGREGRDGTDGAAPTSAKTKPVTCVSWRDVVLWCNAYSEKSGKTPAYYSDAGKTTVIKTLSGGTVYVKTDATGYRLPTEAEWEAAARGGVPADTAWSRIYAGSGTIDDVAWYWDNACGVGSSDAAYGMHPVGGKDANSAGLYDMSGNVWEWCFDGCSSFSVDTGAAADPAGAASGAYRVSRGGCWKDYAPYCAVDYRIILYPDFRYDNLSFRVASAP